MFGGNWVVVAWLVLGKDLCKISFHEILTTYHILYREVFIKPKGEVNIFKVGLPLSPVIWNYFLHEVWSSDQLFHTFLQFTYHSVNCFLHVRVESQRGMLCGLFCEVTTLTFILLPETHIWHHPGSTTESSDMFDDPEPERQGRRANTTTYRVPVHEVESCCGQPIPGCEETLFISPPI